MKLDLCVQLLLVKDIYLWASDSGFDSEKKDLDLWASDSFVSTLKRRISICETPTHFSTPLRERFRFVGVQRLFQLSRDETRFVSVHKLLVMALGESFLDVEVGYRSVVSQME